MITDNTKVLDPIIRARTIDELQIVNDVNFNILKVIEEAFETGELLTKRLTKAESHQPTNEDLVEEIGDLEMRLEILKNHLGIMAQVDARKEAKLALLYDHLTENEIGTTVVITKKLL